jgi:hypothetical protein
VTAAPAREPLRWLRAICGALGILLILLAVLLGYATRSLFNERAFADRITRSLDDPRFATFVAEGIADAVIQANQDLVGLRPVLVGVGRIVVTSTPFRFSFRRGVRLMHHTIMSGTGTSIVLTVQDVGTLLESLTEEHPRLAKRIPGGVTAALGRLDALQGGEVVVPLVRMAGRMRAATVGFLVLGIVLCAAYVWLAREKRQAIVRLGIAFAVLGLVLAITARFGGAAVALGARVPERAPALAALAGAFLAGLMTWAIGLLFAGLVLAAASASLLERVPLQSWGAGAWRWLIGPQRSMRVRLLRGLLGAAFGGMLLKWPLGSLIVIGWALGLVVGFAGLREAFIALLHLFPRIERKATSDAQAGRQGPSRSAIALVGGVTVVVLAAAAWVFSRSTDAPAAPGVVTTCNGSPGLCDRTLDQVVFATTHNSMGAPDQAGWMFPNQGAGLRRQLEDGIRGFMIDVHYGVPVGAKVRTEVRDEANAMAKYEAEVGKEGVEAALRMRDRMRGEPTGERDVYLCHGFCELGALKLVPSLREMRDFLVQNPGEVLIIVIQDESVSPQDVERCFQESGLIDFVYRGPARPPWPTLREMAETDQRVLVLAENDWKGVDWYHPAFEVMQETPYGFRDTTEFSNRPNRGGEGGSLLLMNHWIETTPMPKPSNAEIVNAKRALEKRIRAFERQRGRVPNLVAVDFYGTGDLMEVVKELNARPAGNPGRATPRRQ